jgi:integrase
MRSRHTTVERDIPFTLARRGGRWHLRFSWRGRRIRLATGHTDVGPARAWAHRRIEQECGPQITGQAQALANCIEAFLAGGGGDRNRKYPLQRFAKANPALNLRDFAAVSAATRVYFQGRAGLSPTSRDNERRALHRFFAWLGEARGVAYPANPAARTALRLPTEVRAPRPPAAEEDLDRLLAGAREHRLYPVLILLCSGLRPAGACRAVWEDIDWTARLIRVAEKRRERHVPLSTWATAALRPLRGRGPVWPYCRVIAHRDLAALRRALGLPPGLTLQAIRRATYTRLYRAGVDPGRAARIMGSSVAIVLRHYVDLDAVSAHDAAEVLSRGPVSQNLSHAASAELSARYKASNGKSL